MRYSLAPRSTRPLATRIRSVSSAISRIGSWRKASFARHCEMSRSGSQLGIDKLTMISSVSPSSSVCASAPLAAQVTECPTERKVSAIRAAANRSSSAIRIIAGPASSAAAKSRPANRPQISSRKRHSSIIRFSRASERTRAKRAMSFTGLVRKSSAPTSSPRRRLATSDRAVTMTTGTSAVRGLAFNCWQTSKPFMPGIITSRRITSGSSLSAICKALRPLYADRTSKYSLDSLASSSFTFASTSSTTSTRADMSCSHAPGQEKRSSEEETFDSSKKAYYRNRLGDIGLAAAVADLLLVALHRERSHRDDRDHAQIVVLFDPLGHLKTGYFGKLNIHQDQIGMMLTGERKRFKAIPGLQRTIPVCHEEVIKELHIEVVVLDDQDLLPRRRMGVLVRFRHFERHASPASRKVLKCRRKGPSQSR